MPAPNSYFPSAVIGDRAAFEEALDKLRSLDPSACESMRIEGVDSLDGFNQRWGQLPANVATEFANARWQTEVERLKKYCIDEMQPHELAAYSIHLAGAISPWDAEQRVSSDVRIANCLCIVDILTLGQLAQSSAPKLVNLRNFGRVSLRKLAESLESYTPSPAEDASPLLSNSGEGWNRNMLSILSAPQSTLQSEVEELKREGILSAADFNAKWPRIGRSTAWTTATHQARTLQLKNAMFDIASSDRATCFDVFSDLLTAVAPWDEAEEFSLSNTASKFLGFEGPPSAKELKAGVLNRFDVNSLKGCLAEVFDALMAYSPTRPPLEPQLGGAPTFIETPKHVKRLTIIDQQGGGHADTIDELERSGITTVADFDALWSTVSRPTSWTTAIHQAKMTQVSHAMFIPADSKPENAIEVLADLLSIIAPWDGAITLNLSTSTRKFLGLKHTPTVDLIKGMPLQRTELSKSAGRNAMTDLYNVLISYTPTRPPAPLSSLPARLPNANLAMAIQEAAAEVFKYTGSSALKEQMTVIRMRFSGAVARQIAAELNCAESSVFVKANSAATYLRDILNSTKQDAPGKRRLQLANRLMANLLIQPHCTRGDFHRALNCFGFDGDLAMAKRRERDLAITFGNGRLAFRAVTLSGSPAVIPVHEPHGKKVNLEKLLADAAAFVGNRPQNQVEEALTSELYKAVHNEFVASLLATEVLANRDY